MPPIQEGGKKPSSASAKGYDPIVRGDDTPSPGGRAAFVVLRSIEPVLQYSILAHGLGTSLIHRVGLRTLPAGLPTNTGIALIDALSLSPYRLVLLGMSVGSVVKQSLWAMMLGNEPIPLKSAIMVSAASAVANTINTYAFLIKATSASAESDFPQPALMIGSVLYIVGIVTELISEIQRKRFKSDPKNKGKPYTGGLWQFARHINYGAYTLWRTGYAIAGGGYILGAITAASGFWGFSQRAVPTLNEYCEKKYGAAWEKFKRDTPYCLIPFVY